MMKPSENYPHLDSLIGGWFHQDFDLEGDTLEEVVAAYKKVTSLCLTDLPCSATLTHVGLDSSLPQYHAGQLWGF